MMGQNLTRRSRLGGWAAGIVVALAAPAALAEPEGGTEGWSFTDPVNIAEGRQWAALWWASQDAGAPTPEFRAFRLTNPIWTNVTPMVPAELLFRQIYAHRLNEFGDPELYTLGHLLRDDPLVLAHFRHYTITGELEIAFEEDPQAAMNHLLAIADAATDSDEYSFVAGGDWAIYSDAATSTGLVGEPGGDDPPAEPPAPSIPPHLLPFDGPLRDRIIETPLDDRPGLYIPNDEIPCPVQDPAKPGIEWCKAPGTIGFDCDDFTRAIRAWLRQIIESADARTYDLCVYWRDGVGEGHGHSVLVVEIDGY